LELHRSSWGRKHRRFQTTTVFGFTAVLRRKYSAMVLTYDEFAHGLP